MTHSRHITGLTLIEVMVTISIIIILAALIWKMSGRLEDRLSEGRQKEAFAILDSALQEYYDAVGQFPSLVDTNSPADPRVNTQALLYQLNSLAETRVIVERLPKRQIQNQIDDNDPARPMPELYDVWNRPVWYQYTPAMTFPILRSAGVNGIFEPNTPGISDDVTNR